MPTSNDVSQSSSPSLQPRDMANGTRKSLSRLSSIPLTPRAAMAAAAVFHLILTLGVFCIGRFGLYPQQIDSNGIGEFARDGFRFKAEAEMLANTLVQDGLLAWLANPLQIHIKLYSLSFVLLGRLLGSNILVAEPVNLFCYLAILAATFNLAKRIAGQREAWLASAIVALWPTLLLHTTQFLRDPVLIAAILILVLVLTALTTRDYTWSRNLIAGVIGGAASLVLWMSRPDMWLVIRAIVFFALVLVVIRMMREKKLLVGNLMVIALLFASMSFMPEITQSAKQRTGVSFGGSIRDQGLSPWGRIEARRLDFIKAQTGESGSMIDTDLRLESGADIIKYVPRAVEIGYFAPFPAMWLDAGYNVGLIGRLLAGIETLLTYIIELLACVFVWRSRRRLDVWLLVLTVMTGVIALGLVVVNVGTLYRMRYPFWILMVVMAAPLVTRWIPGASAKGKADVVDVDPRRSGEPTANPASLRVAS